MWGTRALLFEASDLSAAFFDLKTGLAGELVQKLTNFRIYTALVVPNPESYGKRFAELAYEHRSQGLIRFVDSREAGMAWLENQTPRG